MMQESEAKPVILIIDAVAQDAENCREFLASAGYESLIALTGNSARELLELHSGETAAVILDWNLSESVVVNLLKGIKRSPNLADTEVILESTDFVPEDIDQGLLWAPTSILRSRMNRPNWLQS
jgi:PleD family two-component response regulator